MKQNIIIQLIYQFFIVCLLTGCSDSKSEISESVSEKVSTHIENYSNTENDCDDSAKNDNVDNEKNNINHNQVHNDKVIEKLNVQNNDFAIKSDDIVLGDPDADLVMIEYFSFTCHACKFYHQNVFPEIKKNYIDNKKIAYVIREFVANKQDLAASTLARCRNDKEKYLKFVDILISRQSSWAFDRQYENQLMAIAQIDGMSSEEYKLCRKDKKLRDTLQNNTRSIVSLPTFIGTPTFVIGGKHWNKQYSYKMLSDELDTQLSRINNIRKDN